MIKYIKTIAVAALLASVSTQAMAQPAARRNQQKTAQRNSASTNITTRAQISFPTAQQMDENVVWRRDIYREVDLTKGTNSGLYYPVEPVGSQMNLFTYMFKLVLSGQVKAYEYRIDGNDVYTQDAIVKPLALLDNYSIYYERKDGKLKLDNSDIPSAEVKSYYIKESAYYDQVTATFHKKVIAMCPIMTRSDDFGDGTTKYPLFWVKYDDIAPFLTKLTIMTSDINNAATMSVNDYFVKGMYEGKIYKTNNMLGKTLAQYCPDDSLMTKEQKRIEAELTKFEENIWGDKARKDTLDSIAKVEAKMPKAAKKAAKANRRKNTSEKNTVTKKPKSNASSSSPTAARVSVRRQRH